MGHYCWMCGRTRPNEKFSGSGHKRHLCRDCARRPREERERIQAFESITGVLRQRNISDKNRAHLKRLCDSPDDEVRRLAALVLELACLKPGKRKRRANVAKHRPTLLEQLSRHGLLLNWEEDLSPDLVADNAGWAEPSDDCLAFLSAPGT